MDRSDDPRVRRRLQRRGPVGAPRAFRPPSALLVASSAGVIVFVALAVYAALGQRWPLFFASCVLTAVASAYTIAEGERRLRSEGKPDR
jgi:hypothetical protein